VVKVAERKPLTDEDLLGLVEVELERVTESRSMPDTWVFTVKYQGRVYRVGVIGREAYESVKKHGYKLSNGTIVLRIPRTVLRETGAGWINQPY
jgi:hypothetical protein